MEPNVAASSSEAVATVTLPEWVVFSCDDQLFGVPLLLTREVVLPQPLTRLPGCGAEVGGLMGLRGRVITVFDLGIVLARRTVLHRDYRILVIDHNERVAGLAVDSVAEIARNEAAVLAAPPEEGVLESVRDAVVGVGQLDGRQFLALDPNCILNRLLV